MRRLMIALCLASMTVVSQAKSLGPVGEVFEVGEKSFLKLIEERLVALNQNGNLDVFNSELVNKVASHVDRPSPLHLKRTDYKAKHYYKPEVILNQDITDHKGRVLYPKGFQFNALSRMPAYKPCWLFFNADDLAQMRWAQKQLSLCQNPKLILTGGTISQAEKSLKAAIYFDQEGKISQKLKIKSVPARVTRLNQALLIEEEAILENGDVS